MALDSSLEWYQFRPIVCLPPPSPPPTFWTSNLIMQWIKERGIISICDSKLVGAVVRALTFHQCVPGLISGPGVICGLSLLVLYSAPRGFSPGTPVFPYPQKPAFNLMFYLIWFVRFIHLIWFDLFGLQSTQLLEHSCSATVTRDLNKVIIIGGRLDQVEYGQTCWGNSPWGETGSYRS